MNLFKLINEIQTKIPAARLYKITYDNAIVECVLVVPDDTDIAEVSEWYYNFDIQNPVEESVFIDTVSQFNGNKSRIYKTGFNVVEMVNETTNN
jgi:hypothetical protein